MNMSNDLVDSWRRQGQILGSLFEIITPELAKAKPSDDGMAVYEQLCHIANTRRFWLTKASGVRPDPSGMVYRQVGDEWQPIEDLGEIREKLALSGRLVEEFFLKAQSGEAQLGQYESPVLFLQHMLWHEGYHFALVMLALRLAGAEPPEEWEEAHVWQVWRGVEVE